MRDGDGDAKDQVQDHLAELLRLELTRNNDPAAADAGTRILLESMHPAEVAALLESTPHKLRSSLWSLLEEDDSRQVLSFLHEDVLAEFLEDMDTAELVAVADELDTDDFADLLQQLPDAVTEDVLEALDDSDRQRLEAVLAYPEDTAGGLMNTDTVTVQPRHTAGLVTRYLRLRDELPRGTDALIVVNTKHHYVGMLHLTKLLAADPTVNVREIMDTEIEAVHVLMADAEVARRFSEMDLISAAVVDDDGVLQGRITIDDVVDVIIEDADEAVLARAGLDAEDDTFAPVSRAFQRRAIWLGINLITAFLAAAVINLFEDTIAKVVALAVLMPIVASMGGIAGTQTLTLVIRGIAIGQIGRSNLFWLLNREFAVAALNGLFWAALVALAAALAFQDQLLGLVIAIAMIANMLVAAVTGTLLPSILDRMGIDPAIAGGVVLTTVTDVTGFFVFLGLATWAYA